MSDGSAARPEAASPADLRFAIRSARKLDIAYVDEQGRRTQRVIRPVAMVYYVDAALVAGWCELRQGFRHFRVERIASCRVLDESFSRDAAVLLAQWRRSREERPA